MISYLEGKIILKKDKFIIVEVAGIGYKVFLNRQNLLKLPEIGQPVKLFISKRRRPGFIRIFNL